MTRGQIQTRAACLLLAALAGVCANARSPRGGALPATTPLATWYSVTPGNANLTSTLDCQNFGTESAQADTSNPGTLYTEFMCQGIWKSTDYGQTWTGPINTGTNGAIAGDCAGGITVNPNPTPGGAPTIYEACIRGGTITGGSVSGTAVGFWISADGGVDWTNINITPSVASRQDYYPCVIDPYDRTHLLMPAHEQDILVESLDGGNTWRSIPYASGMAGGTLDTGEVMFVNTGSSSTTRTTWLWLAQQSGGTIGTWRTTNGGTSATWTQVDTLEHPHGSSQLYQPNTTGTVFLPGQYSTKGDGVLLSSDYGATWVHVGNGSPETIAWGTSKALYATYGYPLGIGGGTIGANFEKTTTLTGLGTWTQPSVPAGIINGLVQEATVNDGTHNIFLAAGFNGGLWRYIEP